ncbi:MAG: cell division protein ZapA [Clostridia bacterium]|nr:cell division protein ZapA [Clostridia bacterium]
MSTKNKVEVRIAGKDYTIVGIESDEYIQKVGLYIDKKMSEILKINNRLSTSMAAVLTSINVADDYFKAHENELSLKRELKRCQEELEKLKLEAKRLAEENSMLTSRNTSMQLELAKREAELSEVRNSMDKMTRPVHR